MNPDLDRLQPYPFQKLARLNAGAQPPAELSPIALSIGEPKHPAPAFVSEALLSHLHGIETYPLTRGGDPLRETAAGWLAGRFGMAEGAVDPARQVLPVNGTREALFAFAQAVVDRSSGPVVAMPNPFYQIYEGAALLAGAEPVYLDAAAEQGYLPDYRAVPETTWRRCQLLYLCSPANPSGAVTDTETLQHLIALAQRYDFVIAADECYSEIYQNEDAPPPGLLGAAWAMGHTDFSRCVAFHSLSKRSNLPGLRSGFVAGDAEVLARFLEYRTYHGCAMPVHVQAASVSAWSDEQHVRDNRAVYRRKFDAVLDILSPVMDVARPAAGFYLWPRTPEPDPAFARRVYARTNVTVLPGSYLSRATPSGDPGAGHVRMALVAPIEDCIEAARRIRAVIEEDY